MNISYFAESDTEANSSSEFRINFKPCRQALYTYKHNNKYLPKKKGETITIIQSIYRWFRQNIKNTIYNDKEFFMLILE